MLINLDLNFKKSKQKRKTVVCVIGTTEYYSAIKKEWNFVICDNMDGPWGHFANKQNKSDREDK